MYLGLDISQSAYKRISDKIDEIFSDEDFIVNALEEEQGDMLNHLTDERIRMAGFPKEATHENVNYVYRVKSKLSIELWVEMFVNMYDLEGASDFDIEKVVDDDFQVLAVILEKFSMYKENNYPQDIKELVREELSSNGYNPDRANELASTRKGGSGDRYATLAVSTTNIENEMTDVIYRKLNDGKYGNIDQY